MCEGYAVDLALLRDSVGAGGENLGGGDSPGGTSAEDFPLSAALLAMEQGIEQLRKAATATEESIHEEWLQRKAAREAAVESSEGSDGSDPSEDGGQH